MKISFYEFKKLYLQKAFLFIFCSCFIINVLSILAIASKSEISPKEYKLFHREIENIVQEDVLEYIDSNLKIDFNDERMYSYALLYDAQDEFNRISGYSKYLDSISKRCDEITSFSIFAPKDGFVYKNAIKTSMVYNKIKVTNLPFQPSKGIEIILFNTITDILIMFIVFTCSIFLFTKDKEIGIMNLLLSFPNGRKKLCFNKIFVLFCLTIITNLLFILSNTILGEITYGIGDLNRPIQCIKALFESNYNMSVLNYTIISTLIKSLVFFIWGLFFSFICNFSKSNSGVYILSGIFSFIQLIINIKVQSNSSLGILYDINMISLLKPENIFSTYRNVNIFNTPVNILLISCLTILILLSIFFILNLRIFTNEKNIEYKKISIKIKKSKTNRQHSKIYYEFFKSIILQRTYTLFLIGFVVSIIFYLSFSIPANVDDLYYKRYTNENSGILTENTQNFITETEIYFDEYFDNPNVISKTEAFSIPYKVSAFSEFKERYDTIKKNKYNTEIFYDTGYKRLFGINNLDEIITLIIIILSICVFSISPLISFDKSKNLTHIIFCTTSGKKSYLKRNILISITYSTFSSMIILPPFIYNILTKYGSQGLDKPIQSIQNFAHFPFSFSVFHMIILFFISIYLLMIISSLIMLIISYRVKSIFSATLINIMVFIIPLIIILLM